MIWKLCMALLAVCVWNILQAKRAMQFMQALRCRRMSDTVIQSTVFTGNQAVKVRHMQHYSRALNIISRVTMSRVFFPSLMPPCLPSQCFVDYSSYIAMFRLVLLGVMKQVICTRTRSQHRRPCTVATARDCHRFSLSYRNNTYSIPCCLSLNLPYCTEYRT